MDNLLKSCIKESAYKIYENLKPLLINDINNLDKFKKIYDSINNVYIKHNHTFKFLNDKTDVLNTLMNWQNIDVLINEVKLVKDIYYFKTNLTTLYYIIPHNCDHNFCKNQFNKIINIALTLEKFNNNNNNFNGSVYIFPINYDRTINKKQFNKPDDLQDLEIQYKALTISGQVFKHKHSEHIKQNSVFVIRNEECIKLFIHEFIHYLELDFIGNSFVGQNIYDIVSNFNAKLYGGSFESYTELLSNILNIIFFMLNNNISETHFYQLLKIEILYSVYVSAKLLHLYGYNSNNFFDFFQKKDNDKMVINNIPSIYYYIIKSIYYIHFYDWIDFINNNLLLQKQFLLIEKLMIKKAIQKNSFYFTIFTQAMLLVENNNDLSLRYSLIDDNCNFNNTGGSLIHKYKLIHYL